MTEEPRRRREKRTLGIARRANLPTAGTLRGIITIVQEDRFRLQDEQGRGYLLTAGRSSGVTMDDLHAWSRGRVTVTVTYRGAPDLGAIAEKVQPLPFGRDGLRRNR